MSADEQPIPSVWTRPRRKEQPALSRERIVADAVRLLDADGIEALSMRTLSTRLGAGATSLYRHVANKDELIELVVDEVYGELVVPDVHEQTAWRTAARETADNLRAMILRHPWMTSMLGQSGLAYLGPNMMRLNERLLTVFETAGFAPDERDHAMSTLVAYVMGMASSEAAYLSTLARSGKDERVWLESLGSAAEQATREHPRLREEFAAIRDRDPRRARESAFDYGVQRVLDGLQIRLG
ncbi:TetR/AcrR family transcriptional regulator C-terminal domain-containing protein [Nocardia sp. NPDC050799]|uniref:TetR/AcrR family transcriptional regulator n=1 Tax=Nocardia sp. NPDC050799 TaxID=3154842 RepID=UPI0033D47C38